MAQRVSTMDGSEYKIARSNFEQRNALAQQGERHG